MLDLLKAQITRTSYATRWRWRLRDNPRLAVERSRIEVGRVDRYSDCFRVLQHVEGDWIIVSEHRKKTAAMKAVEKRARTLCTNST